MSASVLIGKLRLQAGLNWRFHADRAAMQAALKAGGQGQPEPPHVAMPCDDGWLLGTMAEGEKPIAGTWAGGLVVGAVAPDCLVHHQIGPDQIWVCALRDGMPLPDTDLIGDATRVAAVMVDVLAYRPETPIYGSHSQARSTLEDLLAELVPPAKMALRGSGLDWRRLAVLGGATATVLALAAYSFWPEPALPPMETGRSPGAPKPVAQVTDPVSAPVPRAKSHDPEAIRAATEAALMQALQQPAFTPAVNGWLATLRGLPMMQAGYRMRELVCSTQSCTAEWVWTGGKMAQQRPESLPGGALPAVVTRDMGAVEKSGFPQQVRRVTHRPVLDEAEFVRQVMAATSRPGLSLRIDPARSALPAMIEVAGDQMQVAIGSGGKITVSGGNLLVADQVAKSLDLEGLMPVEGRFSVSGGAVSFTLEADYVVNDR